MNPMEIEEFEKEDGPRVKLPYISAAQKYRARLAHKQKLAAKRARGEMSPLRPLQSERPTSNRAEYRKARVIESFGDTPTKATFSPSPHIRKVLIESPSTPRNLSGHGSSFSVTKKTPVCTPLHTRNSSILWTKFAAGDKPSTILESRTDIRRFEDDPAEVIIIDEPPAALRASDTEFARPALPRLSTQTLINGHDSQQILHSFTKESEAPTVVEEASPPVQPSVSKTPTQSRTLTKTGGRSFTFTNLSMTSSAMRAASVSGLPPRVKKRPFKRGGLAERADKLARNEAADLVLWNRKGILPFADPKSHQGFPTKLSVEVVHVSKRRCNFLTIDCKEVDGPSSSWKVLFSFAEFEKGELGCGSVIQLYQPWTVTADPKTSERWIINPLFWSAE